MVEMSAQNLSGHPQLSPTSLTKQEIDRASIDNWYVF